MIKKGYKGVLITLILITVILFSLSTISAADNENTTVISDNNVELSDGSSNQVWISPNGNGFGASEDDPTNLKSAIDNIEPYTTINFLDGLYYAEEYNIIARNVTLQAVNPGEVTISGNNHYEIFRIGGSYITLSGLTFTEGRVNVYGGAVYWFGMYGLLKDCTFIDNYANSGGAVFWDSQYGTLVNCTFIGNTGGYAGALHWSGEDGLIANSTFISNTATGSDGGAFHLSSARGTLENCLFIDNTASRDVGGAVYWSGVDGVLRNCTFIGNRDSYGCSIYTSNNLYLENNTVDSDLAIYNDGLITSPISVVVLDNSTAYVSEGSQATISAEVVDDSNNRIIGPDLVFEIDGEEISSDYNNQGLYTINRTIDNTETVVSASYNYGSNVTVKNGVIKVVSYILSASDIEMYYRNGTRYSVFLADVEGNPIANADVTIRVNGVDNIRTTDEDGIASLAINLNPNTYEVTASYEDANTTSHITVLPTISSNDIVKYFRNGTQYNVQILDNNGNPLANESVEFNINGVFYYRSSNSQGIATLSINLNPGEYIITAQAPNGERISNSIEVLPTIVKNNDLVKYFRNGTQYNVQILDNQGNTVAGQNVTFNINGVLYNRLSNENGIASLAINLNPGNYIVTAYYNGYAVSNNIQVLPIIESRDIEMSDDNRQPFEVKILDNQGNPAVNESVIFNINGVFYDRISDGEGISRLNINLMPGEYIITSEYNGLRASNTVLITP